MAWQRLSFLFSVTTAPPDLASAVAHSGGWSESHWRSVVLPLSDVFVTSLARKRANLLPSYASCIGVRSEVFTVSGNKLFPQGTDTARFLYPGGQGESLNLPQDALQCVATTGIGPNASRFTLRCLPDFVIESGEYYPTTGFKTAVTTFFTELNAGWGFVGRDRSQPSSRVNHIAGNVVTFAANIGGTENVSFIRFNRTYDDLGLPIKGTYLITNIAGNVYTVQGLNRTLSGAPSGSARVDLLTFFAYVKTSPQRAVTRKIGRPFEQYRGRRSTSRV